MKPELDELIDLLFTEYKDWPDNHLNNIWSALLNAMCSHDRSYDIFANSAIDQER